MFALPADVLRYIAAQLHAAADRYVLPHVCKRWRALLLPREAHSAQALYEHYARENRAALLDWLYAQHAPMHDRLTEVAVRAGSFDALRWAHQHRCKMPFDTCNLAVRAGSLACLCYAYEHGAPWHADTCAAAALARSLACLRYAHEHGAPWDASTCYWAATHAGRSRVCATRVSTAAVTAHSRYPALQADTIASALFHYQNNRFVFFYKNTRFCYIRCDLSAATRSSLGLSTGKPRLGSMLSGLPHSRSGYGTPCSDSVCSGCVARHN